MSRRPWKSLVRIAATVAACWGAAAQAQDAGSVTYFFSGDCSSCGDGTAASEQARATGAATRPLAERAWAFALKAG